jgi:hypothetical protein
MFCSKKTAPSKPATILTDNDTSLQVEMASGKRSQDQGGHVLLRFENLRRELLPDAGEAAGRGDRSGIPVGVCKRWRIFFS